MLDLKIEYSKANFLMDIVKISNGEIQKEKLLRLIPFLGIKIFIYLIAYS